MDAQMRQIRQKLQKWQTLVENCKTGKSRQKCKTGKLTQGVELDGVFVGGLRGMRAGGILVHEELKTESMGGSKEANQAKIAKLLAKMQKWKTHTGC